MSNEALRERLETRLAELTKRVRTIEKDLRRPHDRDWQERAIELENDEVLEGLDEISGAEVRQIRAALRRIDDGTYGICVKCRGPIGPERLAAIPSAVTCVECAQ